MTQITTHVATQLTTQMTTQMTAIRSNRRARALAAGREVAFVLAMFGLYFQVRRFTSAELGGALDNAARVVRWERAVGIFHELEVQDFAMRWQWVIEVLDHYYVFAHFPVTVGLLVWAFLRAHEHYHRIRNWYLAVTAGALVVHLVFPLAPPRLLDPSFGFVDTLDRFGPDIYSSDVQTSTANQLAAMPSLHFAWALLVAIVVVRLSRSRRAWLAAVHPAMTLFAIVATANHYVLDAAIGGAMVLAAVLVRPVRRHVVRPVSAGGSVVLEPLVSPEPEAAREPHGALVGSRHEQLLDRAS